MLHKTDEGLSLDFLDTAHQDILEPVVPLLGMHRSGTSLLARMGNLLGLCLGDHLIPPREDNPKGFWENKFFMSMSVNVLKQLDVPIDGFAKESVLWDVNKKSRHLSLEQEHQSNLAFYIKLFFQEAPWGWKDPRVLLLYPFWLRTIETMGVRDIRPVFIIRHPGGAVQSLIKRHKEIPGSSDTGGLPMEEVALPTWKVYNHLALDAMETTPGYITLFEWLSDPEMAEVELQRLARYLDLPENNIRKACTFLDKKLIHHSQDLDQYGDEESLKLYTLWKKRAEEQRLKQ